MVLKISRLLLACLIFCETCYAQDTLITAYWNNTSIGKVKQEITKQTGLKFSWDTIPDTHFYVTLSVTNSPLNKVLDTIFRPRGFAWKIFPGIIAIRDEGQKTFTLNGKIVNQKGEGLSFATITIKETNRSVASDEQGNFSIIHTKENFTLKVTMAGYDSIKRHIQGERFVTIRMEPPFMAPFSITPPKSPPPGNDSIDKFEPVTQAASVFVADSFLLHRVPSRNINDELGTLTGVLLPHPNASSRLNQSPFTLRSRSTIYGDAHALIILDGFPYSGDLGNINPNDIESITIMKDAAACARFGVRAGNGVLVITTRTGAYNRALTVSLKANITVSLKPDLLHLQSMPSGDHIEITKMAYQNGYYNGQLLNAPAAMLPPAAEILYNRDRGLLSTAAAEEALNNMRNTDYRKEAMKYLYRRSLHQQYHLGVRGGGSNNHYNFSVGYDINRFSLTGNDDSRFTINLNNTIKPGKQGPEMNFGLYYSQTIIYNNGFDIMDLLFPYEKLADDQGNSLPVTQTVRQGYKNSVGSGQLLDWNYRPLDEIGERNNRSIKTAFLFTAGLKYTFLSKLEANVSFRLEKDIHEDINRYSENTYLTRNLINQYTQVNSNGTVWRPIPKNGILDENWVNRDAQNINLQLAYDIVKKESHSLRVDIGSEIGHVKSKNKRFRSYGVAEDGTTAPVDYTTYFPMYHEPAITNTIPYANSQADTTVHFYSFFINGTYSWKKRFSASFTVRKDESNIFGVRTNQKGVPLISAGIGWDINRERFFRTKVFSQLRLRLSGGYVGNISRSFSALTGLQTVGTNPWAAPYSVIINAPNAQLRPETVRISNIGLDFSLFKNSIWGSAEYFEKVGTNLLGLAPIDPTAGVGVFQGNVAAMKGHGFELTLNSKIGSPTFQWQSTVLMSYVRDKITKYYMSPPSIWYYCDTAFMNPRVGMPLYSLYSLDFRGLDASNGDPIGALNNFETKDYIAVLQSPDFSNLVYHGPATPVIYGSFRNTIIWKRLELRFNITWKAGYYFRRNSARYTELLDGISIGHSDILQRWKAPGDERITNIPSLQFPVNHARDLFYNYSSVLVEKGDHIRLQDIRLAYSILKKGLQKRIKHAEAYININNIGLIWRANDKRIDPDYVNSVPAPMNITLGIKFEF